MKFSKESLNKLNELIKDKFSAIRSAIPLLPQDINEQSEVIEHAWRDYCVGVGLEISLIAGHQNECRPDLPPPGEALFLSDGVVRIRNIWGDKYVDIPEEFAIRALALGFLP
ncbi:hypothetical protein EBT16_00735 [bacterium]|nr:hypothetical protein [bacterium]